MTGFGLHIAPGLPLPLNTPVGLLNWKSLIGVAVANGDDKELSPADVAREFKVSASMVRRWGVRGWLPPTRRLAGSGYRRYSRADVEKFRTRLEAGEFDGVAEVAANRPRIASQDHEPAPSGGGPTPSEVDAEPVNPPSGGPRRHRQTAKTSTTRRPHADS